MHWYVRKDYLSQGKISDVHIRCARKPYLLSSITGMWKFVDGPSPVNGRVMAWDDGIWGSVCDSNFDDVDASILCRSFNFRQV